MTNTTAVGMNGPMKGVRVLDWTMYQFGPVAASMVGDMGADVIKVESLDGDIGRAVARMSSRPIGLEDGSTDRKNPLNPLVNAYECQDGRWIQFMSAQFQRYWSDFATALGISDLIDDPIVGDIKGMAAGSPELTKIIADRFKTRPVNEWIDIFNQYKDLIFAKVQSVEELETDPQVIANNYITNFNHPVIGEVKMCNFPVNFSETPAGIWKEAPELGQDTESILIDEMGYSWDDITRLQESGSIL